MTKTYKTPMLHVVSINQNNIIATSNELGVYDDAYDSSKGGIYAPGLRFDSWNEGY